ncbi:MAG: S41 family peptidase [Kiritimatiellae bacterium]|nr:S41 family peptidase [Kiritimatiellia bacterium]
MNELRQILLFLFGVLLLPVGLHAQVAEENLAAEPVLELDAEVVATTPEPDPAKHPLVADVDALLANLAAHGIQLTGDEERAPLYECVARIVDPQARLFTAAELEHWQHEQAGVDYHTDIRLTISNATPVVVAAPADLGESLRTGDRIISIQGAPATNVTLSDALRQLRGHTAGGTELIYVRGTNAPATTRVERVLSPFPLFEVSEMWPRDIGYARVNGLNAGSGEGVLTQLQAWADAKLAGGILDLRGADGSDVASAAQIAGAFASPGSALFSFLDRDGNTLTNYQAGGSAPIDLPVMVLVDEHTSGAAEALAATAAGSLRGTLVIGRETAGDPAIRDVISISDSESLCIATRKLLVGDGIVLDGRSGVKPTVILPAGPGKVEYEPELGVDRRIRLDQEDSDLALRDRIRGDAALQRAVDVLLGLKALNIRPGPLSSAL